MKRAMQQRTLSTNFRLAIAVAAVILLATVSTSPAQAQTLTVLHTFSGGADGNSPYSGITFDQQGRIYGTTYYGGIHQEGAVYRLEREGDGWVESTLYSFGSSRADGTYPLARVVFGPDGLLYGTTSLGGRNSSGTVFTLQPPASACKSAQCPWIETVIWDFNGFNDVVYPSYGDLIFDQAGNIYGTGFNGGGPFSFGGVFELTRSGTGWTESVLRRFTNNNDGVGPAGGLVFDNAGNLYGTTSLGGAQDNGTVFELTPTQLGWIETALYSFTNSDNGEGSGGFAMDAQGNLFGITGLFFPGAAFELTPQNGSWSYTRLQSFSGSENGFGPVAPPTFDSHGNLYGPLPGGGSSEEGEIFKLTPSGNQWIYSPFYQFTNSDNGLNPYGAVIFDANGNMYGTTAGGGHGYGTVWEITP